MAARLRELVLGGDGLVGSALTEALRARGHEVRSLDLKSGTDLRWADPAPFRACDRVWFLAWDSGGAKYLGAEDAQHHIYKHNCELAARVFDVLAQTRRPFLFATSQLAGQPNAYGLTKLLAEHWAVQLGGKLARMWNVYGWEAPGDRSHVIPDLVLSGLVDGRVQCRTTGRERRRFLYQSDCAAALVQLFDSSQERADIAGGEWLSIGQVAREVAHQLGAEVEFGANQGEEVLVDPTDLLPSWRPVVPLEEGVSRVIAQARAFLLDQPAGRVLRDRMSVS